MYTEAKARPSVQDCIHALNSRSGNCRLCGDRSFHRTRQTLKDLRHERGSFEELQDYAVDLWINLATTDRSEGGKAFYKEVNKALAHDCGKCLKKLMPLIRCITRRIDDGRPSDSLRTYRGSKLSLKDTCTIQCGEWYRVPLFLASSASRSVAKGFSEEGVTVELKIPRGCRNVADLHEDNLDEREYVLPPYTAVFIVEKKLNDDGAWIVVEVAKDNRQHDLDLPICFL